MVSGLTLLVGRNSILSWTTVGISLLNVVANLYLIDLYGEVGAAKVTLLIFALDAIVFWTAGAKLCPLSSALKSESNTGG